MPDCKVTVWLAVSVPPEMRQPEKLPAATAGTSRLVSNQRLPAPSVKLVPLAGASMMGMTPKGAVMLPKAKGFAVVTGK